MRIALPVSAHDGHLLEMAVAVFKHFGKLERHTITLAPALSQRDAAEAAADIFRGLTEKVDVLPLQFEGEGKWPQSPNLHWAMTMEALHLMGNTEPIFWNELDIYQVAPAYDALEMVWRSGRKPFAGKILPKPTPGPNGVLRFEPDDLYMMGCAVYPPDMMRHQHVAPMFRGFYAGTNPDAFDFYLRGFFRGLGWTDTNIIADRWNTGNYRMDNGKLVCDALPSQFKHQDYHTADVTDALLIHGCKDQTLPRLILGAGTAQQASKAEPAIVVTTKKPEPFTIEPRSAPKPDAILETLNEVLATVRRIEERVSPKDVQEAKKEPSPILEPQAFIDKAAPHTSAPAATEAPIETIRGMVADKPLHINKLANALAMPHKELLAIIHKPGSGMKVKNLKVTLDAA